MTFPNPDSTNVSTRRTGNNPFLWITGIIAAIVLITLLAVYWDNTDRREDRVSDRARDAEITNPDTGDTGTGTDNSTNEAH